MKPKLATLASRLKVQAAPPGRPVVRSSSAVGDGEGEGEGVGAGTGCGAGGVGAAAARAPRAQANASAHAAEERRRTLAALLHQAGLLHLVRHLPHELLDELLGALGVRGLAQAAPHELVLLQTVDEGLDV